MNRKAKKARVPITWKEIKRQKFLMICALLFVIYGIIFYYVPLGGWIMAFQNYKPRTGLLHSAFVGLDKFKFLFSDATFLRVLRNTLAMGILNLVTTFVTAIAFAILLNEVRSKKGKKWCRRFLTCRISFLGSLLPVSCMTRCLRMELLMRYW